MTNIKREDVKKCCICNKGVLHDQQLQFYRIKIDGLMANTNAIHRQAGLEQMLGGHAMLAQVMGPDADLAQEVWSHEGLMCFDCAVRTRILEAVEAMGELEDEEKDAGSY